MARPTCVQAELQLRLVVARGRPVPVRAGLRYEVDDPYAVQVAFHTGAGAGRRRRRVDVRPHAAVRRRLLGGRRRRRPGLAVGTADGQPVVCLSLSSPSGRALFEVPLSGLVEFLAQTYAAVPTGTESDHVDVDAELALLLWGGRGA